MSRMFFIPLCASFLLIPLFFSSPAFSDEEEKTENTRLITELTEHLPEIEAEKAEEILEKAENVLQKVEEKRKSNAGDASQSD